MKQLKVTQQLAAAMPVPSSPDQKKKIHRQQSFGAAATDDTQDNYHQLEVYDNNICEQQQPLLQAQISAHLELSRHYLPKLFSSDAGLTELRLAGSNCGDISVTALSDGLKGNTSLRLLDLSDNGITDDGCVMIAEAIEQNRCLISLSLARNCVGDRGAARMVDALCVNNSLLEIDVTENESISQTQLSEVTMLAQLNAHSSRLKQTLLQLRRNEIGDTLDLSREAVQMKEFRDLEHNQREHLDDWAAEMLSKYLADNKTVTFVDLSCHHIGDVGAYHIAQMLRRNTKIDRLVLQRNLITSAGAQHLIDAVAQSNNSLRFLSLFKNALSHDCAVKLEWVMAVNRQPLTLKHLLAKLEANDPSVTAVVLDDHLCQRFYDDVAARLTTDALRKNTHVKSLAITNSNVTVVGARFIADLLALSNSTIELVDLSHCPIGIGAGYLARSLGSHIFIKTVRLAYTGMTDLAASHLAEALRDNESITELDISHNPLVNSAGEAFVRALNKNVTVEKLLLDGTSISDRVLQEIAERQRLLSEPEHLRHALPLLFAQSSSLRELDLDGKKFTRQLTDSAMGLLSEALGQNYVTQRCSLANNRITYTGIVYLAGALSENSTTLTHLDLSNNPIMRGAEFGRLLAGILDMHSALQVVDVSGTGLDDLGARSIIAIHNKDGQLPLRQLNFSNNRDISAPVAFILGVLVQMNSLLFSFKVRLRPILSRWLSCIDMALPFTDAELDLSSYASGEVSSGNLPAEVRKKCNDAAQIVCRFALLVPTISFINFSRNGMGCDGAEHFANLLVEHPGITSMNLAGNCIEERGGLALQRGVEKAPNLNALDLTSNPSMPDHVQSSIRTIITYNLQTPHMKRILVRLRNRDESLTELDFSNREGGAGGSGDEGDEDRAMLVDEQVLLMIPALDGNPHVTKLDLSNNFISLTSFAPLCALLQKPSCTLRTVSVRNTNLVGTEVGVLIQQVLSANEHLHHFDISYNDLGDEAGRLILAAVRQNTTLKTLRSTSCNFSAETSVELTCASEMNTSSASSGLKDLLATTAAAASSSPSAVDSTPAKEFDGCDKGFSSGNAIEICNAFKHSTTLEVLDLSRNDLSDKCGAQIFQILASNTSIRRLNLSVNCFGREALRDLAQLLRVNTSIIEIDLRRNDFPLDDLIVLSESLLDVSDTIQCIRLQLSSIVTSANPIAARRVVDFFEHTLSLNKQLKLKRLLPLLRRNDPSATEIDLAGLACNDVGARFIGDAITHNTSVLTIDVSRGEVGDAGLVELCRGLCVNRSVVALDLSWNNISDDGVNALCDVLKVNSAISKINVAGNPRLTQRAVDNLRQVLVINDSLRSLHIVDSSRIGSGGIRQRQLHAQQQKAYDVQRLDFILLLNNRHGSLKDLMRSEGEFLVREVNCSNAAGNGLSRIFDDRACEVLCNVLAENRFVTSVDISNNSISPAAAEYLESLLLQNRSITELNLSYNHLGDGVMKICDVLKHNNTLRVLRVEHNGASAATIERTQLLLSLNLEPLPFKKEMLRILDPDPNDLNPVCRVNIPQIEYIPDRKRRMNDDSVAIACGILKSNLNITSVDFSSNDIGDNGFSEILRLLRRNVGISSVSLAHNAICDESIRELHANIHHLQHFTSLDLSHNAVTAETFPDIIRILSHNFQLQELKINGNRIPPQKVAVIDFFVAVNKNAPGAMRPLLTRAYENTSTLTEVVCDGFYSTGCWTKQDAMSMRLLAFSLQANTTVRLVSVEFNDIDDASVPFLAGLMSVNSAITSLSLANNLLEDISPLIKALLENKTLQVLNLRSNRLNLASAQAIKQYLLVNKSLVELDVSRNAWGNLGASTIVGALSMNSTLKVINVEGPGVLPATVDSAELGLSLCYAPSE